MNKNKIVMCFGTFDVLHLGHIDYFKQAKKDGDYLIVIVSRDFNISSNKKVRHNENDRLEMIRQLKIVDKAVLGSKEDKIKPILDLKPKLLCLGYDQDIDQDVLKEELLKRGLDIEIKKLKPYKEDLHKSSLIKSFH